VDLRSWRDWQDRLDACARRGGGGRRRTRGEPRSSYDRAFASGVHVRTGTAIGLPEESAREAFAGGEPAVLLLDTFDAAGGLEDWLREQFVPALPARSLVVVAGRNAPGRAWRRDPGWGDLLRVISLRNLEPDDARAFLLSAGVAEEHLGWMSELSHGHPLAL
jgi:hypothetical protein